MKYVLIAIICFTISGALILTGAKDLIPNPTPLIQIMDVDTGNITPIKPGEDGVDISRYTTKLPSGEYNYISWSKCNYITGVLLQTPKGFQSQVTIYYKVVCK